MATFEVIVVLGSTSTRLSSGIICDTDTKSHYEHDINTAQSFDSFAENLTLIAKYYTYFINYVFVDVTVRSHMIDRESIVPPEIKKCEINVQEIWKPRLLFDNFVNRFQYLGVGISTKVVSEIAEVHNLVSWIRKAK